MNSNAFIASNANAITDGTGCGLKYNSVGHGNGASLDFYVLGVVKAYVDSTGIH